MTKPQGRILVVDDEADIRANLSDILTDLGYDVDTAPDGLSAMELVHKRPYDVALLDLKMPGMDGLELYRRIKQHRSGTVAIIVTAYASPEVSADAQTAGAWQILSKPVDFSKLLPLVDEAVAQPLVMIVDDDHELCETLWDLLRESGYRVCIAHDEPQARERLTDRTFDVLLIDMKLPAGDGASVLKLAHETNPQARSILITGHRSEVEERLQQLLSAGADAVCYKPFDVKALLQMLQNLIDRPK